MNGSNTVWNKEAGSLIGSVVTNDIAVNSSDNRIAAGTHGRGIFIGTPNSSVSIENDVNTVDNFVLNNNYPNPFNPSTKISFVIPDNLANQVAKLMVYDALGKEISTLINKPISGGLHEVNFNAEGLASGIYIYKLSIGNLVQSKKMILAK